MALANLGALLPVFSDLHAFLSDVGWFFILQGSQFDYRQAYLAYHRSLAVDWDDEAWVRWVPYTHSSLNVLDIPAREVISAKSNVDDVQRNGFMRSAPLTFKAAPRNTHKEARVAVNDV